MKALSPFSGGNRTPRMWFYTKKLALGSLHDKRTFASFVLTSSFAEITRSLRGSASPTSLFCSFSKNLTILFNKEWSWLPPDRDEVTNEITLTRWKCDSSAFIKAFFSEQSNSFGGLFRMGSSWFIDPEKGEALSFDSSRVWILGHGILLFSIPVHKVFFSTYYIK